MNEEQVTIRQYNYTHGPMSLSWTIKVNEAEILSSLAIANKLKDHMELELHYLRGGKPIALLEAENERIDT